MRQIRPMRQIRRIRPIPLLLFLFLVVFGLLVPLKFAWAWNPAKGLAKYFAEGFVAGLLGFVEVINWPILAFLWIADFIVGMLTAFVSLLLYGVMKITMGGIPLIPHAGADDVVTLGWTFTRDLANIFFVVILAWVAFATILRRKSYEVKTILPKIFIIAILINFIPVITGVIVDIAQIITKFFMRESIGAIDQWLSRWVAVRLVQDFWQSWDKGVGDFLEKLFQAPLNVVVVPLAGIIFNLFSIFIFLFYGLLFIMRIVAIWILIILAPLCWLGYIIPGGGSWWKMWWNQFILWTIIGIPMSFFLYLAGQAMGKTIPNCQVQYAGFFETLLLQVPGDILCTFLPYIASIMILVIGMAVSLALTPRGSKGLIQGAQKAAKWGMITAGVAAARHGGPLAQRLAQGLSEKAATGRQAAAAQGGVRGWMKKAGWGAAGLAGSGMQWSVTEAMTRAAQAQQKKVSAAKAKILSLKKEEQLNALIGDLGIARWNPMNIPKVLGDIEAIDDKHNLGWALNQMTDSQRQELVKLTAKNRPDKLKDVVKHQQNLIEDPVLGPIITSAMVSKGLQDDDVRKLISVMSAQEEADLKAGKITRDELFKQAGYKKMVDALSGADIEGLTKETLDRDEFKEMAVRFKKWDFNRRLIDEAPPGYVDELQKKIEAVGLEEMAKTNPRILRLALTPGGQEFGLKAFINPATNAPYTAAEMNALIQSVQAGTPIRNQAAVDAIIAAIP